MKIGQIRPTFLVPEKTVNFFEGKPVVPSSTLKMRKSHKKLARVYAYTHAYTQIRDGGGKYARAPFSGYITNCAYSPPPVCPFFLEAAIVLDFPSMSSSSLPPSPIYPCETKQLAKPQQLQLLLWGRKEDFSLFGK